MTQQHEGDRNQAASESGQPRPPAADQTDLAEEDLDTVVGGMVRRGNDDDLDDLEIQR